MSGPAPPTARPDGAAAELCTAPPTPLTVAAGQAACTALDIPANIVAAAGMVQRSARAGAALLILPELFLTGYELEAITARPERYAVSAEDPRLEPLAAACAATGTVVVVGAPVRDATSGDLHISALVLGRSGRLVARYDKQHLDAAERVAGFTPGPRGCTLTLEGWRVGLGICWDASFPEHARAAALDGCGVYLVSALFNGARGERKRRMLCPARALDNAMYTVAANHCGPSGPYTGCGGSAVWDPEGNTLADAGADDPGIAVARLDPAALARARAADFTVTDPSLHAPVLPRHQVLAG